MTNWFGNYSIDIERSVLVDIAEFIMMRTLVNDQTLARQSFRISKERTSPQ